MCDFSLKHYRDCLDLAVKQGYRFHLFERELPEPPYIILRHDVDYRVSLALRMAGIEARAGVQATYYIRFHAPYNALSLENYRTLKAIHGLGHDIGLHYEREFAELVGEDNEEMFKRTVEIANNALGFQIRTFSAHNPSPSQDNEHRNGLINAYHPQFLKQTKFISDSLMRWREGCMCEWIKKREPRLCILTHPFWWYKRLLTENW